MTSTANPRQADRRALIAAAIGDAAWLPHRYDPVNDLVHFLPVPRDLHRRSTFLTDSYLPTGLTPLVVPRLEARELAGPPAPLHFIVHAAFCCSTVLARAFDRPGVSMGLKEPTVFHDIVGWRRCGEAGPDMVAVIDDILALLARPFGVGEAIVIKPSNVVHMLIPTMLSLRPEARAILLYASLRTYLGSIAKKGLDGRLWVRVLLLGLVDDTLIDLGFSERDYLGLTDLQVAAVGWLAQQSLFAKWIGRFGSNRLRTLDSDVLTTNPKATMSQLGVLFGLPMTHQDIDEIVTGVAFTRHSKFDAAFVADDRRQEERAATERHADEIEKVIIWAEAVAAAAGVEIPPPARLTPSVMA